MEGEKPNRGERRRAEREGGQDGPSDEPFKLPKVFDACPNPKCGSKRRFVEESLKHDVNLEGMGGKIPILFSFEYPYETPLGSVRLIAYGDACYDCGMPYIIEMVKVEMKPPKLHLPPGSGRHN